MLFVGPSGIGKSSASIQQDILWALGRPAFGIKPARPLRILTIQAENDDGDLSEMSRGVCNHLNLTDEERKLVHERVIYSNEKAATGEQFLRLLRRLLRKYRPDIIRIDPLHAYAGGDVREPAITTPFLRNGLNPILQEFRCAAIVCHHTPKTTNRDTTKWNESDWMYAGAGNADITNWARAILVIESTRVHGAFIFRASKRGSRVGWADEDGHRVYDRLFCHHAGDAIFWRDATDDDTEAVMLAKGKKGEPPKTKEEFKALVPLDEPIPKLALIQRANMKGFGLNHAKRLLSDLIADKELFELRKARKGTCHEVLISRREETLI
jgi:RecA-family ATPase